MTPLRFETGVPAGSPTVTVDGVSLAYDRQGAGPPVNGTISRVRALAQTGIFWSG